MLENILLILCCSIAAGSILYGLKKYALFSRMIRVFARVRSSRFGSSSIPMTIETRPETAQTFVNNDDNESEELPLCNPRSAEGTNTLPYTDAPRIGS